MKNKNSVVIISVGWLMIWLITMFIGIYIDGEYNIIHGWIWGLVAVELFIGLPFVLYMLDKGNDE